MRTAMFTCILEYVDLNRTECIRMPEEYKYPDIITYMTEFRDKTPNGIPGDAND